MPNNRSPADQGDAQRGQQPGKHIEDQRNDPLVQEGAREGRNRAPLVGPDSLTGVQESQSTTRPGNLSPHQLSVLKAIEQAQRVTSDDATWAVKEGYGQQAEDSDIGLTDKGRKALGD